MGQQGCLWLSPPRDSSAQTALVHFGTKCPKVHPFHCASSPHKVIRLCGGPMLPEVEKTGGWHKTIPRTFKEPSQQREFFEQIGEQLPQGRIVLLKLGNLLGIDAPVGVGLDRHLIEVIRTPAL